MFYRLMGRDGESGESFRIKMFIRAIICDSSIAMRIWNSERQTERARLSSVVENLPMFPQLADISITIAKKFLLIGNKRSEKRLAEAIKVVAIL